MQCTTVHDIGKKEDLFFMEETTTRSNFIWDAIEQDLK